MSSAKKVQTTLSFGGIKSPVKKPKLQDEKVPMKPPTPVLHKPFENIIIAAITTSSEPIASSLPEKNVLAYNPAQETYDYVNDACWHKGCPVPYYALAKTFDCLEAEPGRLKSIQILANFYCSVLALSKEDLLASIYLTLNQVGPSYLGKELGVGDGVLFSILKDYSGLSVKTIKQNNKNDLDLGNLAQKYKSNQVLLKKAKDLTVHGVFQAFEMISNVSGNKAVNKKTDEIKRLYTPSRSIETKFLFRAFSGKLRIGCSTSTVLHALSQAVTLVLDTTARTSVHHRYIKDMNTTISSQEMIENEYKPYLEKNHEIIKKAYLELPHFGRILDALYMHPVEELLQHCSLTAGIPLSPMLANPCKSIGVIFDKYKGGNFTCEYKYDGERAQIHYTADKTVHIYSRNLEDNTGKFPEILTSLPTALKRDVSSNSETVLVQDCILDTEIVAYDPVAKKILPFQVLTTRKRKNVDSSQVSVQILVYAFDLIYLNGESLVSEPLNRRRKLLVEYFTRIKDFFDFATFLNVSRQSSNNESEAPTFLVEGDLKTHEQLVVEIDSLSAQAQAANSRSGDVLASDSKTKAARTLNNKANPPIFYSEIVEEHDMEGLITKFMNQAICDNTEGLMIKSLVENSTYEIAVRSKSWLKLKKDYLEGIGDTLDLTIVGAYYGAGKRMGVYGAYLLACYDPESEKYQTICKIGTGLSDELLKNFHEEFKSRVSSQIKPLMYEHAGPEPDVWIDAYKVLEIKAADLTLSPVYRAAYGEIESGKGISLRFPRLIRERQDKTPEESTSSARVAEFYRLQGIHTKDGPRTEKLSAKSTTKNEDSDFYSD